MTTTTRSFKTSVARIAVIAVCAIALSGCLRAYRMDIQQGNVVTQDMVAKLKLGMSQREVRFALGSPMIEDPFHADRWDYAYSMKKGRDPKIDQSIVTVIFKDGRLAEVIGDASAQVKDERTKLTEPKIVDPSKAKKSKVTGFWERLKNTVTRKKN